MASPIRREDTITGRLPHDEHWEVSERSWFWWNNQKNRRSHIDGEHDTVGKRNWCVFGFCPPEPERQPSIDTFDVSVSSASQGPSERLTGTRFVGQHSGFIGCSDDDSVMVRQTNQRPSIVYVVNDIDGDDSVWSGEGSIRRSHAPAGLRPNLPAQPHKWHQAYLSPVSSKVRVRMDRSRVVGS